MVTALNISNILFQRCIYIRYNLTGISPRYLLCRLIGEVVLLLRRFFLDIDVILCQALPAPSVCLRYQLHVCLWPCRVQHVKRRVIQCKRAGFVCESSIRTKAVSTRQFRQHSDHLLSSVIAIFRATNFDLLHKTTSRLRLRVKSSPLGGVTLVRDWVRVPFLIFAEKGVPSFLMATAVRESKT